MAVRIKHFAPSTDWFFVFTDPSGKVIEYPVVGFATIEGEHGNADANDRVVGMVSVTGGGNNTVMPGLCGLTTVPPVEGTYKHRSELKGQNAAT